MDLSDSYFDDKFILDETQTMIITASETSSLTISTILIVLGIYPEVQVFFSRSKIKFKKF